MNEHIEELKQQWTSAQPLKSEDEERLWQKYRLEWNYNEPHRRQHADLWRDRASVLQGQTTGSHDIREYEEMKAHDVAIFHVRELAKSAESLTESDIRGLNKIILKELFWKTCANRGGRSQPKANHPRRIQVFAK